MIFQNKQNWKPTAIGEIAFEYSKRCDNPSNSGYDKFVGSENIDRFDYKVKNWQSTDDVISAMKLFEKDDYLLVRRSLYASDFRERAPRADFDGVCSGDILTIKENEQKIANGFLYCILNSKQVWEFIVANASGSITRRIKWPELSKLQIPLPPLSEQKQIAALFQSLETAMEQVDGQEKNLLQLKNKLLRDLFSDKKEFGNHLTAKDFETVRFDRIAINISERVEPKKTELKTYVGLEHLDADNLVIERTGTPDDVIGTKLKIYKGDIIFGKRRAYLRKVAVSHFDGIASAHSMILRANEKNIEKDFLPYFMQSDAFMNRAVQISEGSLSPTIKVKTLAQQEFNLPKKEKQKELVTVFKQFDGTMQHLKQQKATLKLLKQKLLNEILG